jgi:hypothetical protein
MTLTRVSIGVAGAAAIVSALLVTLTMWVLMTDPTTMAAVVDRGTVAPIVRALADALVDVFRWLLRYL